MNLVVGQPNPPETVTATFCATLVDELVRCGLRHAVIAPGSRNTPLSLALVADERLETHVVLDERSAGFLALGIGARSGRPALVCTTSGTASVELHPSVVEAYEADVPLIVATADRPPELLSVGAPQAIEQRTMFDGSVRFALDPGVPDEAIAASWRSMACRVWVEAIGRPRPGPVHLNLAFRDPLVGTPGPLPPGRVNGAPWHVVSGASTMTVPSLGIEELGERWAGLTGVFVCGHTVGEVDDSVNRLGAALGWPVLADQCSGLRVPGVVRHADAFLRSVELGARLRPDVIVRLGEPHASKVLSQWTVAAAEQGTMVASVGNARWSDPERIASELIDVAPNVFARSLLSATLIPAPERWLSQWCMADDAAAAALDAALRAEVRATEPGTARLLLEALGPGDTVVASSSMPIRDLDWYGGARSGVRVMANRGANGIDGVVSTAVGAAISERGKGTSIWLLIGDLALLHDSNGLLGLGDRDVRMRIVVVDNAGGGIFSFLPQAGLVEHDRFERLFGTPQPVRPESMLAVHGIVCTVVDTAEGVRSGMEELATHSGQLAALVVRTDRAHNVEFHGRLHEVMQRAARGSGL